MHGREPLIVAGTDERTSHPQWVARLYYFPYLVEHRRRYFTIGVPFCCSQPHGVLSQPIGFQPRVSQPNSCSTCLPLPRESWRNLSQYRRSTTAAETPGSESFSSHFWQGEISGRQNCRIIKGNISHHRPLLTWMFITVSALAKSIVYCPFWQATDALPSRSLSPANGRPRAAKLHVTFSVT